MKVLVAVATKGQGKVNEHFGHAHEFQIYEVSATGTAFIGHRRVDHYCQGGWGDDDRLPAIVDAIADCHAVLAARIGTCPRDELAARGIEAVDGHAHEFIESGLLAWFGDYRARIARGDVVHRPRGDAPIRVAPRAGSAPSRARPAPESERIAGSFETAHRGASHADLPGTNE